VVDREIKNYGGSRSGMKVAIRKQRKNFAERRMIINEIRKRETANRSPDGNHYRFSMPFYLCGGNLYRLELNESFSLD